MTAPPPKRKVVVCHRKRRFTDEFVARAAAQIELEQRHVTIDKLWVYRCHECSGWHLTSKAKSRKSMVTLDNLVHERDLETQLADLERHIASLDAQLSTLIPEKLTESEKEA